MQFERGTQLDQLDAVSGELSGELVRRFEVNGVVPGARTAKDGDRSRVF